MTWNRNRFAVIASLLITLLSLFAVSSIVAYGCPLTHSDRSSALGATSSPAELSSTSASPVTHSKFWTDLCIGAVLLVLIIKRRYITARVTSRWLVDRTRFPELPIFANLPNKIYPVSLIELGVSRT
jgi:hypothetical protein